MTASNDNAGPVIRLPAPVTPDTVLGVEISSRCSPFIGGHELAPGLARLRHGLQVHIDGAVAVAIRLAGEADQPRLAQPAGHERSTSSSRRSSCQSGSSQQAWSPEPMTTPLWPPPRSTSSGPRTSPTGMVISGRSDPGFISTVKLEPHLCFAWPRPATAARGWRAAPTRPGRRSDPCWPAARR